MKPISYRIVKTPDDVQTVANLAREVWIEHYTPIIGMQQVAYMLDKFQSKTSITLQLTEGYEYTLWSAQQDAGYLAIRNETDALFISKIYVLSEYRGTGYGKQMMIYAMKQAQKQNLNKMRLTVNKYNTKSIAAYEKMGFYKKREVIFDIGNGYIMDDYEMELEL